MFGARIFSMPASCLAGWGCCSPHTLLNIYMEEPYEHKRDHTHKCTLKHSHWYKNRCSQTHIVLICCCFKTYFVILVMCAAQYCCCSLSDVVSSVVFSFCQQVSKQIVCYLFLFFCCCCCFFLSLLSLSLSPILLFSLSLSPPSLLTFPTTFFFFSLFLLSLSCFLCPLVLSVIVGLNKRVYKIKLIN